MSWVLLVAWAVCAVGVALPLVQRSLIKEPRLSLLLAFALIAGLSIQTVLLLLLWGILPLGTAFWVVLGVSSCAFLVWLLVQSRSPLRIRMTWGMAPSDSAVLFALLAGFAYIGYRIFTSAYTSWDAEALYWHSSLVGWMGKGTFPPTSPLEPDDLVRYRFGFHALPSAIASITGGLPPHVMAATVASTTPMIVVALVGASVRTLGSPRPGFVASILVLLGGSLLPIYRFVESVLGRPVESRNPHEFLGGLLNAGNTLDMLHNNVTVAMGFVYAAMALWACWEFGRGQKLWFSSGVTTLAVVSTLGLVNEVYFAALAPAFLMLSGLRSLRANQLGNPNWWHSSIVALVILASAYLIVSMRGGFLGGISLAGDSPNSVRLALNTDHFGYVPAPPGIWEPEWLPLFSTDAAVDTVLIFVGLPLLAVLALWRRASYPLQLLVASTALLGVWISVYPKQAPWDGYRFYQAAFSMYLVSAAFVLNSSLLRPVRSASRVLRIVGAAAVAAVILPHSLYLAWAITSPPPAMVAAPGAADYEASIWLRSSEKTSRVLVPLESSNQNFMELYYGNSEVGTAMRSILGLSGHVIPIGHGSQYWNPEPYIGPYRTASMSFNADSLADLKIDWVYVLPHRLSPEQRGYLDSAAGRGELTLARTFDGTSGPTSERQLFRVLKNPGTPASSAASEY